MTTIGIVPATAQEIWAKQVFEFTEALRQELTRFDNADDATIEALGNDYFDGQYDCAEQLRNRFYEIFGVSEGPVV